MYKKITLTEIKQEAKDLKKQESKLKHAEALNQIAQKYGYEKYEILKDKFSEKSYIEIEIDITEPISFLNTQTSNETFNPMQNISEHGAYIDVFNTPSPEADVKKVLDNVVSKVNFGSVLQKLENKNIVIIGGSGSGKTTLIFLENYNLDRENTLFLIPESKKIFNTNAPYNKIPLFKHAIFKTQADIEINFTKFNTIVIDESFIVLKNKKILSDIVKIIADGNKTVIMTFQSKDDAKHFGFNLKHILDIRNYDIRSVPLDLYEISVAGAGMSYVCEV